VEIVLPIFKNLIPDSSNLNHLILHLEELEEFQETQENQKHLRWFETLENHGIIVTLLKVQNNNLLRVLDFLSMYFPFMKHYSNELKSIQMERTIGFEASILSQKYLIVKLLQFENKTISIGMDRCLIVSKVKDYLEETNDLNMVQSLICSLFHYSYPFPHDDKNVLVLLDKVLDINLKKYSAFHFLPVILIFDCLALDSYPLSQKGIRLCVEMISKRLFETDGQLKLVLDFVLVLMASFPHQLNYKIRNNNFIEVILQSTKVISNINLFQSTNPDIVDKSFKILLEFCYIQSIHLGKLFSMIPLDIENLNSMYCRMILTFLQMLELHDQM
jgi:hypothetical protein